MATHNLVQFARQIEDTLVWLEESPPVLQWVKNKLSRLWFFEPVVTALF